MSRDRGLTRRQVVHGALCALGAAALPVRAVPQAAVSWPVLTPELANRFAAVALAAIQTEYPNKPDHVLTGPQDVLPPRAQHPVFYGSFDWHSSVHGHWMLVRLLRRFPGLTGAADVRAVLDRHFTADKVAGELAYQSGPERASFERPYGWGWLLRLAQELAEWPDPQAQGWSTTLAPLTRAFAERFIAFLPKLVYPIRVGTHTNTALAMSFALDYARAAGVAPLEAVLQARANAFYGQDRHAPAGFEPSGYDFLSPALIEADLMRRVLDRAAFARWLTGFLPELARREPKSLFAPGLVRDRSDGHLVHLDGLNLSRAWCWRGIAQALPPADPRVAVAHAAARTHAEAGLVAVLTGHYAGEHWLPQFATYLLTSD